MTPEHEKQLLERIRQACNRPGGTIRGLQDSHRFLDHVARHAFGKRKRLPWPLLATLWFYRTLLYCHIHFSWITRGAHIDLATYRERERALKFGATFGRHTDEAGREWAMDVIDKRGISFSDAALLIWSRTLDVTRRKVFFGHWNWISGIVQMTPVYLLIFVGIGVGGCCAIPFAEKVTKIAALLVLTTILATYYKAQSFDVFKAGRTYLALNGLGIRPTVL